MKIIIAFFLSALLFGLSEYVLSSSLIEGDNKYDVYFLLGSTIRGISIIGFALSLIFMILRKKAGQNRNALLITLIVSLLLYSYTSMNKVTELLTATKKLSIEPVSVFESKDYEALIRTGKIPLPELSKITKGIAQQNFIWKNFIDVYVNLNGDIIKYSPLPADTIKMQEHRRNINRVSMHKYLKAAEITLCIFLFFYSLYRLHGRYKG